MPTQNKYKKITRKIRRQTKLHFRLAVVLGLVCLVNIVLMVNYTIIGPREASLAAVPQISSVTPSQGSYLGGDTITITGNNFNDAETGLYRTPLTITNPGNVLTDFQISFELNTYDLISQGKMRSDCGDLRVFDTNSTDELAYWVEKGCGELKTKIWTKVPQINSGNTIIYLGYGEPTRTNQSNGDSTFEFFEDFSGSSLDSNKWGNINGIIDLQNGIGTFDDNSGGSYAAATSLDLRNYNGLSIKALAMPDDDDLRGGLGAINSYCFDRVEMNFNCDGFNHLWWSDGQWYAESGNNWDAEQWNGAYNLGWQEISLNWLSGQSVEFVSYSTDIINNPNTVPSSSTQDAFHPYIYARARDELHLDYYFIHKYTGQSLTTSLGQETGLEVYLGGQLCASVILISSNELTCQTSAHPPGPVDLVINNPSGDENILTDAFEYILPNQVELISVSPNSSPAEGGVEITLNAQNFAPNFSQELELTNPNALLLEQQFSFTIDTQALIATGKMRSDCGDLRILDTNQVGQLPYWIEEGCNTTQTKVWTKISEINSGQKSIYLSYGDSSLTSESDGNQVFEFFDDFSGSSLDTSKWTDVDGTINLVGGIAELVPRSYIAGGGFDYRDYSELTMEAKVQMLDHRNQGGLGAFSQNCFGQSDLKSGCYGFIHRWQQWGWMSEYRNNWETQDWNGYYPPEWQDIRIYWDSNGQMEFNSYSNHTINNPDVIPSQASGEAFHPYIYAWNRDNLLIDHIFIYKPPSEPISTNLGPESGWHVLIDDQPCTNLVAVSSTEITCTVPAHEPATVDVTLNVPPIQSSTLPNSFTYGSPGDPELLAHYDFGNLDSYDGTGQTVIDLSGNNNTATLGSGPTVDASDPTHNPAEGSLVFDGNDDVLQTSLASNFSDSITFEVWFKRSANTPTGGGEIQDRLITTYSNSGADDRLALGVQDTTVQALSNGSQITTHDSDFIPGPLWQLATLTYDESSQTGNLYANGALQQTFQENLTPSSNNLIQIGSAFNSKFYEGEIGVIRIYNRALNNAEVLNNFIQEDSRFGFSNNVNVIPPEKVTLSIDVSPQDLIVTETIITNISSRDLNASPWATSIAMSDLTTDTGHTIPASQISMQVIDTYRILGSERDINYANSIAFSQANDPQLLVQSLNYNGGGAYTVEKNLIITVPAYSPAGLYQGTITYSTT